MDTYYCKSGPLSRHCKQCNHLMAGYVNLPNKKRPLMQLRSLRSSTKDQETAVLLADYCPYRNGIDKMKPFDILKMRIVAKRIDD